MTIRTILRAAAFAALLGGAAFAYGVQVSPALAATQDDYTAARFAQAQADGKPILIHVTATWCPTCARQHPILSSLEDKPEFKDLTVLNVDFDSQKSVVQQFGVRMQSTLIVFHGKDERGRSTGDTNAESIKALLEKANA